MTTTEMKRLADLADHAVRLAVTRGADEAEAAVASSERADALIRAGDVFGAKTSESTSVGIRIIVKQKVGFATVNDPSRIEEAIGDALALARAGVTDPFAGLPSPEPLPKFDPPVDPSIEDVSLDDLVGSAGYLLDTIESLDPRVSVDSGEVNWNRSARAIASSKGVACSRQRTFVGGTVFGMAVDGTEVGSFDGDGDVVTNTSEFHAALAAAAQRFVTKCVGALKGGAGVSMKGPVILTPEAVCELILPVLLGAISARAIRLGRSPYVGKIGTRIAAPGFSLIDPALDPRFLNSSDADREGLPCRHTPLITDGMLNTFLYDSYEARRASVASTGHAVGGATALPSVGVHNLEVPCGDQTLAGLAHISDRCLLVTRWSGSSNPVTGDFSGVAKGAWMIEKGERRPVREVQISGNVFDLLLRIAGVSSEARVMEGTSSIPAMCFDDVTVTAG